MYDLKRDNFAKKFNLTATGSLVTPKGAPRDRPEKMYSQTVLEHFQNPHNQGQIPEADGIGEVGNPVCGDVMKIYLKIKKAGNQPDFNQDIIEDIKFETLGCGAAIASTSMLTDMVKGKSTDEALKITKQDVADALGGLPKQKVHCSVLAVEGLAEAIKDYKNRKK